MIVSNEVSRIDTGTGQQVNRSIKVRRCSLPFETGMDTKPAWTWAKRLCGTSNSWMGGTVCLCILAVWQAIHSHGYCETSLMRLGQTNFAGTDCLVCWTPGWPSPCMTSNILFLKFKGTNGLAGQFKTFMYMYVSPIENFLNCRTVRVSLISCWKSGLSVCWCASSSMLMSKWLTALITALSLEIFVSGTYFSDIAKTVHTIRRLPLAFACQELSTYEISAFWESLWPRNARFSEFIPTFAISGALWAEILPLNTLFLKKVRATRLRTSPIDSAHQILSVWICENSGLLLSVKNLNFTPFPHFWATVS